MSQKLSRSVRIITLAPFMATLLFVILYIVNPAYYANFLHFIAVILFIAAFPILAYPLSYIIPKIRKKGRNGQRSLAIVFSVLGYLFGFAFALISRAPNMEKVFYATYLISGILMFLLNFVFKVKSSGHACGVSGPVFCLSFLVSWFYLFGYFILVLVSFASFKLKSHDTKEIIIGALIPVVSFFISYSVFILL